MVSIMITYKLVFFSAAQNLFVYEVSLLILSTYICSELAVGFSILNVQLSMSLYSFLLYHGEQVVCIFQIAQFLSFV